MISQTKLLPQCHQVRPAYGCSQLTFTGFCYTITTFVTLYLTVSDMTQPENFWFFSCQSPVLQGESVNPVQFCSPISPQFPCCGIFPPHNYDVFLRILALKVCALNPHSSHLQGATWILKQMQQRRPNPWVPLSAFPTHLHQGSFKEGAQLHKWK